MFRVCRKARNPIETATYHVILRGSSEITLFKSDKDKERFLKTIKKYQNIFRFKVLAYCVMSTHVHLLIASNGANLSKFMHGINLSYAIYYNKNYDRHGHVFSDRFKSKVAKNESVLKFMSAYIHNNPKDIAGYKNRVEEYEYSSLGIYLGTHEDTHEIIDSSLILNYYHKYTMLAQERYLKFVKTRQAVKDNELNIEALLAATDTKDTDIHNEIKNFETNINQWQYTSGKVSIYRTIKPNDVIKFICMNININSYDLQIKYRRSTTEFRAFSVFLMRSFCDIKFSEMSSILGGLTSSALSNLCNKGYALIKDNSFYNNVLTKFLEEYPA